MLIEELPGDGVKCISNIQSHCEDITFADKIGYDSLFQQVTHKVGESKYISKCTGFISFSGR